MKGATRFAQTRILKISLFSAGAAHQNRAHTRAVIGGESGRTLRRFVIRVCMNSEHTEIVDGRGTHDSHATADTTSGPGAQ